MSSHLFSAQLDLFKMHHFSKTAAEASNNFFSAICEFLFLAQSFHEKYKKHDWADILCHQILTDYQSKILNSFRQWVVQTIFARASEKDYKNQWQQIH